MLLALLFVALLDTQEPQRPAIPQVDLSVEVVGALPIDAKIDMMTRLLGLRQAAGSLYRRYPPTILELLTLVTSNPQKPRGRNWDAVPP